MTETTTFARYLTRSARRTDTPEGDFIVDARHEIAAGRFPPKVPDWARLEDYLHHCSACPEAIAAARVVWARYQRWAARQQHENKS